MIKNNKYDLNQSEIVNLKEENFDLRVNLKLKLNYKEMNTQSVIWGSVLDSINNPIENAVIKLMDENLQPVMNVYSDLYGKYIMTNIPKKLAYNILATAVGKKISNIYKFNILVDEMKVINFNLDNDSNNILGTITGSVFEEDDTKKRFKGAVVSLFKEEVLIAITYTNEDGDFVISELQADNYNIKISALGYDSYKNVITVKNKELTPIIAKLKVNSILSNGIISGIITDDSNGIIANADVFLYSVDLNNDISPIAFTKSNESGLYVFLNVPVGRFIVKSNESKVINSTKTPTMTIPVTTVPITTIPTMTIPVITIPIATVPTMTIPSVITPIMTIPTITTPITTIPNLGISSITIPIIYKQNAIDGQLLNGARSDTGTNFAGYIGGPTDGSSTLIYNISNSGTYKLSLQYIGADTNRPLKIDINGVSMGTIYTPIKTDGWVLGNAKIYNLFVNLLEGENSIKFHGDSINFAPSLGEIKLTLISQSNENIYILSKGILLGGASINENNNFVDYIGGPNNGSLTIKVNVEKKGVYNCKIQYLSVGNNRTFKVDINEASTGIVYTPEETTSWNVWDTKIFNIQINLISGSNTLKFYGDGLNYSPNIRTLSLSEVITNILNQADIDISNNWRFNLTDIVGSETINFDDFNWRELNLPHDWSIELDFNKNSFSTYAGGFLDGGISWYRKIINLNSYMVGKKVFINFEGIYMESTIFVNGINIGSNENGYTPFSFDITNKLNFNGSANIIAVKVKNTQPNSRWYSGSGIYRKVTLTIVQSIYVEQYGVFITTPSLEEDLKNNYANVNLSIVINNTTINNQKVIIRTNIYSPNETFLVKIDSEENLIIGKNNISHNLTIQNPILWDIYSGNIYTAIIEVIISGNIINQYKVRFGFRYFKFDSNTGFYLNGNYNKIKGVCMHDNKGALGAADNYDAVLRQVTTLKNMGINAIRTSHNPVSSVLVEICEDEGILVMEEAFDCWSSAKTTYDYGRFFNKYAKRDLQIMINKDKNSPAIIIWSIGNEIDDTDTVNGITIAKNLIAWIKEIDNTRVITIGENKPYSANANKVWDMLDLAGYNYGENYYDVHHNNYPNRKIIGSETSSAVRSRGVYLNAKNSNISDWTNLQTSSYDNSVVSWGRSAEDSIKQDRDRQFVAGQFIWTGFDYIGEPTPFYNSYPAKSSYFGIIDTAGFEKDIYYFYQSQWIDKPMVHLLPHWNWSEGESIVIWAYANVDTVELFLNDVSQGEKKFNIKSTNYGKKYLETWDGKLHLEWEILFQKGTLRAEAKSNGQIVAIDIVKTAEVAYSIKLVSNKNSISADGKSLAFISVYVVDSKGVIVPTANNLIEFKIYGGILVGVDNGNAASVERYKDVKITIFNGKALAIVQSNKYVGEIILTAFSTGLISKSISINKN